jgi:hypothetical protein
MAALQHVGAAPPGPVTPRSDNAPCQARVEGNTQSTDAIAKAFATLQAQAALVGVQVERIEADGGGQAFIVSRWNLTRQCDTIDDVRELLRRMGVAA